MRFVPVLALASPIGPDGCRAASAERLFASEELNAVSPDQNGDLGAKNLRFILAGEVRSEPRIEIEEASRPRWFVGLLPSKARPNDYFLPVEYRLGGRSITARVYYVRSAAPVGDSSASVRSVMFAARLPDLPAGRYTLSVELIDYRCAGDPERITPAFAEIAVDPAGAARVGLSVDAVLDRLADSAYCRTVEDLAEAHVIDREDPGSTVVDEKGRAMAGRIIVRLKEVATITPRPPTFPPLRREFEVAAPTPASTR